MLAGLMSDIAIGSCCLTQAPTAVMGLTAAVLLWVGTYSLSRDQRSAQVIKQLSANYEAKSKETLAFQVCPAAGLPLHCPDSAGVSFRKCCAPDGSQSSSTLDNIRQLQGASHPPFATCHWVQGN